MGRLCIACMAHCDNSEQRKRKDFGRLFGFPKDTELKEKWSKFCDYRDPKDVKDHHRVCAGHFLPADFKYQITDGRNMVLHPKAVPSIRKAICYSANSVKLQRKKDSRNDQKNQYKYCVICGLIQNDVSCFKFPSNFEVTRKWAEFCNMDPSEVNTSRAICQIHFKDSDFLLCKEGSRRRLLKKDSIPSLMPKQLTTIQDLEGIASLETELPSSTSLTDESYNVDLVDEAIDEETCHQEIVVVNLSPRGVGASPLSETHNRISDEEVLILSETEELRDDQPFSVNGSNSPNPCDSSTNSNSPIFPLEKIHPRFLKKKMDKRLRYIGDVKPEDLDTPERAKYAFDLAKKNILHYRSTIRKLRKENVNLKNRLISAIEAIENLSKNKTSEGE